MEGIYISKSYRDLEKLSICPGHCVNIYSYVLFYVLLNREKIRSFCASRRGLGGHFPEKLIEIFQSGRLSKMDSMDTNIRLRSLEDLQAIHGVGAATAQTLYDSGIRSLSHLLELYKLGFVRIANQDLALPMITSQEHQKRNSESDESSISESEDAVITRQTFKRRKLEKMVNSEKSNALGLHRDGYVYLTRVQYISLPFAEDKRKRIPREEVIDFTKIDNILGFCDIELR